MDNDSLIKLFQKAKDEDTINQQLSDRQDEIMEEMENMQMSMPGYQDLHSEWLESLNTDDDDSTSRLEGKLRDLEKQHPKYCELDNECSEINEKVNGECGRALRKALPFETLMKIVERAAENANCTDGCFGLTWTKWISEDEFKELIS